MNLRAKKTLAANENEWVINLSDLKDPQLWSPDHPSLYTVEVTLKKGKTVIDRLTDRCGYRWYEFKEKGPFYLNGERLLLRGTHRHEEMSG